MAHEDIAVGRRLEPGVQSLQIVVLGAVERVDTEQPSVLRVTAARGEPAERGPTEPVDEPRLGARRTGHGRAGRKLGRTGPA